ncbi:spore germination protein [Sporolactobacillus shoreicorticis]|uniref:Spore germination protein n=1 Tax=Sporolactobacillus shoreicorticis TaxID=1923877 RepID=A0ABW5S1W2_9BACL|nr:spore germination protein [Sporolactobacillus shoreicorticis]MCO7124496.1 spore germination protein [Sporolactobacillus shoreicorticis]
MFKRMIQFRKKQTTNHKAESKSTSNSVKSEKLSKSLSVNIKQLKTTFGESEDVVFREFYFGVSKQTKALVCFIDGLGDKKLILESIVKSLMVDIHIIDQQVTVVKKNGPFHDLSKHVLSVTDAKTIDTFDETVKNILAGNACLLIDGNNNGFAIDVKGGEKRNVEAAKNETVIRGPQEAFVETLRTNTSLLRRIIKNPNLIFEHIILGKQTHTDISIAFIRGIANDKIVEEVKRRLSKINIDAILESGYVEQLIEDRSFTPFATVGNSEKPDKVAAKLLEGRVAILCDGTPVVLTVPYIFAEAFQVPDDYYSRMSYGSIVRASRFFAFAVTLLLPALFVAITTFHQEMIPTVLLIKLTAAREGIPFPALIETLISELIFLLIRESGIRMPRATGSAVTIVGSLVMGDAAVSAGIVGAPMVIVTSLSGITGLTLPAMYNAVIVFRYLFILLGGIFGLYGVTIGLLCLLAHMCALRSFGVPFMTPFAPLSLNGLKDSILRLPLWSMNSRPKFITWRKSNRQSRAQRPSPTHKKGK